MTWDGFIAGKPDEFEDQLHQNWLPTLNLGHGPEINAVHAKETLERYQRAVS